MTAVVDRLLFNMSLKVTGPDHSHDLTESSPTDCPIFWVTKWNQSEEVAVVITSFIYIKRNTMDTMKKKTEVQEKYKRLT